MRNRRVLRGLAALTTLTLVVAACGDDDDAETTPVEETDDGAAEEVDAQEISVTAVDFAFEGAPGELDAGLVTVAFDNEGEADHEIAFVEIGDTPLDQFLPEFAPVLAEGAAVPAYADNVIVPGEIPPGESAEWSFTIAEGTYAMFCALTDDPDAPEPAEGDEPAEGAPHFELGMAQTITVGPGDADVALPEADGAIAAADYTFTPDIEAGDTTINFTNAGPDQIHFAAIQLYPEGTDVAAAEAAFAELLALPEDQQPPEDFVFPEDVGFSGVASTGLGNQFTFRGGFESGRTYILACFIQDRAGGPPHALPPEAGGKGMYTAFTVE